MRHVSENEERRVRQLLELSEEQLYATIGSTVSTELAARRRHGEEEREGRRWIADNMATIRSAVCGHALTRSATAGDATVLVITISDVLVKPFRDYPTFAIAALIVKIGLGVICRGYVEEAGAKQVVPVTEPGPAASQSRNTPGNS